jgi:8-hydroxy-5-deazaflavin:NADPH oxidoreductase
VQTGIIGGTGAEGRGLAARLAAAGVSVLVGSREMARAQEAVRLLRESNSALPLEPATNADVIAGSEVIFLAVPFSGAGEILEAHGPGFRPGTLVVDVTVPLTFRGGAPAAIDVAEGSAAEFVRARLPDTVRVAASLKTIPASILGAPATPLDCDEFVCGDSAEARAAAIELLERIPTLRLVDAGGLDAARTIERMTALAIAINRRYKVRASRFRVVGL